MRDLNIDNVADLSEAKFNVDDDRGINRRQVLKGLGIVTATLVLAPKSLLAQTDSEAQEWRDLVHKFIFTVSNGPQARAMESQLEQMTMYRVTRSRPSFHWAYASEFIFDGSRITSQQVICGNGFQIIELPSYDADCPCNDFRDLNRAEIATVIDPFERERFGCVLAPASPRVPLNNDHARYVGKAAAEYRDRDLNDWYVPAERQMIGNGRVRTGFHLVHRTQKTPSGKPKTDFIVSSDI